MTKQPPPSTIPPPPKESVFYDEDLDDRDFANRLLPREAYRGPKFRSVTMWIIITCVAVSILDVVLRHTLEGFVWVGNVRLLMGPLQYWGHFSQYFAVEKLQLWRF